MDLAVSVSNVFGLFTFQVFEIHRNHCCFFLFNIDKFNQTLLATCLEVPPTLSLVNPRDSSLHNVFSLFIEHHLDVPLSNLQFVVFNNVEGSLHSTCIGAESNLSFAEVSYD